MYILQALWLSLLFCLIAYHHQLVHMRVFYDYALGHSLGGGAYEVTIYVQAVQELCRSL